MKVKRFNNLWAMGLILFGAILVAFYVLKIFFPEFVIEVAQIEFITTIGHYIDNNKWATYFAGTIISMATYYLLCCACCRKKTLNWKEILIIFATNVILYLIKEFLPKQYTIANLASMLILPCIFKGDFKITIACFTILNVVQTFTLEIRNIAMYVSDFNFATAFILLLDYYIVQVVLYFFFNYKKRGE